MDTVLMPEEVCDCEQFKHAQKRGTDHDGYDPAIFYERDGWMVGMLDPIEFCPWCGKKVPNGL
jgi:hypothetical protein